MQRLSESQKAFFRQATEKYHASYRGSPAEEYIRSRGLGSEKIQAKLEEFRLGYVDSPLPGHEQYQGMLSIPYLRWSRKDGWAVVAIRYRRISGEGKPKYLTQAGDRPRLYNTIALLQDSPVVAVTEGEIDAITAQMCGIPTVGVPGAQAWQPWFSEPFFGYKTVYVLADGDDAGAHFAQVVAEQVPRALVVPCPPGEDVNSLVLSQGPKALLERIRQ